MSRLIALLCLLLVTSFATGEQPKSKGIPVKDTYHGVTVVDEYRWLEDWNDEAVREWSEKQNVHARSLLDGLSNGDAVRKRVTEIMSAETEEFGGLQFRGGRLFAVKRQPPKQQPFLVVMDSADDPGSARVVVDPNEIDSEGSTSFDWYVASHDGKLVAVSLSKDGTESGDVHVFDTATGEEVFEVVPRVNGGTAGGGLAWLPDNSGFFYTRYPREGERPVEDLDFFVQVYFHKLGTPTSDDRYEIGKDFPRIAEIRFEMNPSTGVLLTTVQDGDGGEFELYLRTTDGTWRQFSEFDDQIVQATFGPRDDLYIISHEDAPRGKILRTSVDELNVDKATVVVPQSDDTIVASFWSKPTVIATSSKLYVTYQLGGPAAIRMFDLDGKPLASPEQPPVSNAGQLTKLNGDDVLFEIETYVEPRAYHVYDAESQATKKTRLVCESPVNFDDVIVVREFAESKDGTKVPINVLLPKGAQRGSANPCLVTGYGGYGASNVPRYQAIRRMLLDQGMILAIANLRGGGEYGDQWHRQGNLTNKQNVFDDFAAVLRHMIDRKYTSAEHQAIIGGSNGGLLMGATLTQNPRLMKCVVSHVGIYDMLRVELTPNGAYNIPEFGTVKNPDHFRALHAYSPFHNVKDGEQYPATLFLTGANDPRVDPMHSRKMTARMQAASPKSTVLLRTSSNSGHGLDTALSERIEQSVDVYSFLFDQLGLSPVN